MSRRTRALVVSPDPGLVQQVRSALDAKGVPTETVSTATEAFGLVASGTWGLVIAAASLPDRSGYDLVKDLKSVLEPPLVLLVGEDRDGKAISRSHAAGADGFIHRPLKASDLIGRIRDLTGPEWFEAAGDIDSDWAPGVTGAHAESLVDPGTGMFDVEDNTGYSVSVIDDGDSDEQAPTGHTQELPALAIEAFDEAHPVAVPVDPLITAHGLARVTTGEAPVVTPDEDLDAAQEEASAPPVVLGPNTGKHGTVRPRGVATLQDVDARLDELLEPGGALSKRIEDAVTAAVTKALADSLPAVIAGLRQDDT